MDGPLGFFSHHDEAGAIGVERSAGGLWAADNSGARAAEGGWEGAGAGGGEEKQKKRSQAVC